MIQIFRTAPTLDFLTIAKALPDISGRVTALVPKAREVGEPSTASGPVSNGEDALLLPVERRNGEVPLGVCECLATGLTCHVLGGGGVSLNLIIDINFNLLV
ncbi:hypothetical protein ALC56_04543 [Trachymyrmex septentrionalis]|uniref:Uncharacterized protein n=1 Tax=Trachymyrmex septentrionalis TaxID=34720 RepID=A0A195FM40_9HYME|nr:hypothetical protein ALC56_04543 [Trachymyrmex septentrionalis]